MTLYAYQPLLHCHLPLANLQRLLHPEKDHHFAFVQQEKNFTAKIIVFHITISRNQSFENISCASPSKLQKISVEPWSRYPVIDAFHKRTSLFARISNTFYISNRYQHLTYIQETTSRTEISLTISFFSFFSKGCHI